MVQKDFFKQLREELNDHPFKDRFLEELEDHVEDLENDKELKEEFIESEMIKKYLGEPKEVKENFLNVMHPFANIAFYLEGFCYGMLILPINLICFITLGDLANITDYLFSGILKSFLYLILLFLIYVAFLKRYLNIQALTNKGLWTWIVLITCPSALWLILSIGSFIFRI